jgi:DNA-directed RNA polymerase
MDMKALAQSEAATLERFNTSQDRVARDFGYGQTIGALGITQDALKPLTEHIQERINNFNNLSEADPEKAFLYVVRNLSAETIALSALNEALGAIAVGKNALQVRVSLAHGIAGECWAKGLLEKDEALFSRIDRVVRRKHGNLKYRKQAARSVAARAGFRVRSWDRKERLIAGNVLLDCLLKALPEIFQFEAVEGETGYLIIAPGALALAERAVEQALRLKPVFVPCTEPPKPWTGFFDGGYWDERTRLRASVVRTFNKETVGAVRAAIKAGAMQPHLDALNALQSTAWTINKPVLEVLKWAYENKVPVAGLPPQEDVPKPVKPDAWEFMDDTEKRTWKYKFSQVKERNRSFVSNRVLFKHDTETADLLAQSERFWTPMNCDWRGRVYSVCHFNFQRDDRVRALFLFADGQPIGEDGLRWLKIHAANCGGFDKIDKKPLDERVKWTDENLSKLLKCAGTPKDCQSVQFWTKAKTPFLFLAACMELTAALAKGPQYLTRLPVSFDGSCSGLQHLAAMTRDEETAKLVNLIPSATPQDVYESVADLVTKRIATDSAALAKTVSAFGVDRALVKRNVMTYSYSSKKFGMSQQLVEDLMRPLAFKVLAGELDKHPFGDDDGRDASKYLASHIYDAIETLVHRPAAAMRMLQKCARALAHEGKPVAWETPLGLPWINRYHAPTLKRLNLWLNDSRVRMVYADGGEKQIDKDKAANGVAPNFVHALDATHLLMVALACSRENITQLATVHDSFGCLAPQAARFNQIVREQFVKLYEEHDVLKEVLDQAKHDLTVHNQQRLPTVPDYGSLNLREVINAEYAFA